MRTVVILIVLSSVGSLLSQGQSIPINESPLAAPTYHLLREDDDWTFLADRSLVNSEERQDFWDPIKYIPLRSGRSDWFLSMGGEAREIWEQIGNDNWGQQPFMNGYFNQRYMFHFDVHYGNHVRSFVELKSGLNSYRIGGPRPIDEKKLDFQVFVHQKWTPFLMMLTLFQSLQQMNEYADDITYRMNGHVEVEGDRAINVSTMLAPSEAPVAPPMALAGWWGDKFNRLFLNPVAMPKLKSVEITVDLLPERRTAAIDYAWTPSSEVDAGTEIPVKVFLRPYRGERIERDVQVKIPAGMPKGEHRILFSDADTLNRMQNAAVLGNRYMDIPETISLLNQERGNSKLYVSLVEGRPTYYADDKTLPSLPSSVLNVLQAERTSTRVLMGSAETATEQLSVPIDHMVSGSYSLKITVK